MTNMSTPGRKTSRRRVPGLRIPGLPTSVLNQFITVIVPVSCLLANSSAAIAQQPIQDEKGNTFMEEVVDEKQAAKEEAERKKESKLDRHPFTPEEAARVGVQITPEGKIVPLLNRGDPVIQQQDTTFTQTYEPWWTLIPRTPWGTPLYGNPFMGVPHTNVGGSPPVGAPYAVPYGAPYGAYPLGGVPYSAFPYGGVPYGGIPGYGFPAYGGISGTIPGIGGITGYFTGGGYSPLGNPLNPFYPYAPGAGVPYYMPGTTLFPPTTSFTYSTTPAAPNAPPSTTISTQSSFLNRPFWSGYGGVTPWGTRYGGLNIGLPTVTQYDSTTTFTPIAPHFSDGKSPLPADQ